MATEKEDIKLFGLDEQELSSVKWVREWYIRGMNFLTICCIFKQAASFIVYEYTLLSILVKSTDCGRTIASGSSTGSCGFSISRDICIGRSCQRNKVLV